MQVTESDSLGETRVREGRAGIMEEIGTEKRKASHIGLRGQEAAWQLAQ